MWKPKVRNYRGVIPGTSPSPCLRWVSMQRLDTGASSEAVLPKRLDPRIQVLWTKRRSNAVIFGIT